MRTHAITVGYRELDGDPEIIAGPDVPHDAQEAALDAAARADDGGEFRRIEIWYNGPQYRGVTFTDPEQKARDAAAAAAIAAERKKKPAKLSEVDKAKAEAEAAKARAEAAEAELAELKARLEPSTLQGTPPGGDEAHNLVTEGSTPSPATTPTPETEDGPGAAERQDADTAAPRAPVSGKRKP